MNTSTQAECDKQVNQVVDQFMKKRQFTEKVPIKWKNFISINFFLESDDLGYMLLL